MQNHFYHNQDIVLLNYTKTYPKNEIDVLNSEAFKQIFTAYFDYVMQTKIKTKLYLLGGDEKQEKEIAIQNFLHFLKKLLVFDLSEIKDPYLEDRKQALEIVENLYNFYRKKLRLGLMEVQDHAESAEQRSSQMGSAQRNFISIDTEFNRIVLSLYRILEEKLQGFPNKIYRQLNAASDGSLLLRKVEWQDEGYEKLKDIGFIDTLMLRTPLILHPSTNKRTGSFDEIFENPIHRFTENPSDWMCYPAKIGESLSFLYFHKDFIASGITLANLFELAIPEEYRNKKPDLICLFGMQHEEKGCKFYYDEKNQLYVGYVAYEKKIEYFGYFKKTALTLHNVSMLAKKKLPIHGSMVKIFFKNGKVKNVAFMGDSGAGKSETIEALRMVGEDKIDQMEVIFDDMGSFALENGKVVAQGTEVGAFVRLDDLEKGTAYRDMNRSIFMNPETDNARVVLPSSTYETIIEKHPVDIFLYANNYDDRYGMKRFENIEDAKHTFIEGKRKALGTTQEVGISTTFFANPFGPQQKQEESMVLINQIFESFLQTNTYLGEIYTRLGVDKSTAGLKKAAEELLTFLEQ